ncbi:unnamed protein product [Cuscuta europaea]|uniref:Cytochrome b561 and DOMON domain-containing protein n=1 Tax=Cuscuta europaea TaxID=41803 RepID=A0A9P0YL96_CUSEU|nr:unnamed protein product [Cuscuta europaea]
MNRLLWIPLLILGLLASNCHAQNCSSHVFSNNAKFATCIRLPVLNSFLHWTYHSSNHTADIAYRQTNVTASSWVSWALNLVGKGMVGSQCLVAVPNARGGGFRAYTSPVSSYATQLAQGPLSFTVPSISAEFANQQVVIFATLVLPANGTSFTTVWQNGPMLGTTPGRHPMTGPNMVSIQTVDFATGQTTSGGGKNSRFTSVMRRRNIHGVLNAISWGILMPVGAMIARYVKVIPSADPAWFYLHAGCQFSGYVIGVAGWGTGMKLGSDSKGITFKTHRCIGITLFCLATLQLTAAFVRPHKDHKYRPLWKYFHTIVGYTTIALGITNVYKGFDALGREDTWKKAYTGVIVALGIVAVILEAITWPVVIKRKRESENKPADTGYAGNRQHTSTV